jgi:hypothetical protein
LKRELTKEEKRAWRAYYFDRARVTTGYILVFVFGVLVPGLRVFGKIGISFPVAFGIAAFGLIFAVTSRSGRAAMDDEKKSRRR